MLQRSAHPSQQSVFPLSTHETPSAPESVIGYPHHQPPLPASGRSLITIVSLGIAAAAAAAAAGKHPRVVG